MRCKNCDYPLWNLPARKCPECGTDFKPSDFHFVPNSVRFLCPHCEQCYYGTTPEGQLIPRTFNCVTCGQHIDMDEMLLFPAEGVQEQHTAADVMPWLQRRQLGWFKGWIRTIGMAMGAPHKLVRAMPLEGGLGESAFFLLITHVLVAVTGACIPLLLMAMLTGGARGGAAPMIGGAVAAMVAGTVGTLVVATLWALLTHGLLKISGGTPHGVGRTMQAFYYSSGVNIIMGVPCIGPYCGGYVLWIWWMVSAILMVMEGQKSRGLRATFCVGAGPALGILALGAYIMLMVYFVAGVRGGMVAAGGAGGYPPAAEARAIHTGILAYAMTNGGQGPAHGIELVADNYATASTFSMWQIGHDEANVPLPNSMVTLDGFQYLPANRMRMTAQAISQSQPAALVAHRVADVVFTYHGMNLNNADPGLWIAVICPDPDQTGSGPWSSLMSTAVWVDGTTVTLTTNNTASLMQQQNALRAKYGLAPLPDLSTITNSKPAASGAPGLGPGPP